MDEFNLFGNAFNLIASISLILALGISAGGLIASIIGVITQIDDKAIRYTLRFVCLIATCYLAKPYLTGSLKEFTITAWDVEGIAK